MRNYNSDRIQILMILLVGCMIAGILIYMIPVRYRLNITQTFDVDQTMISNPLMGFAPMADNIPYCEQANLVFILLPWSEWEPQQGVYDVEALEKKYHISRWKEEHKHAVLRFVCDIPGEMTHIDIPGWLYSLTGDGTRYSNSCGKGYTPNYANEMFIKRHRMALEALAEYCNKDDFVSYIQLGSIGHWGEWHCLDSRGNQQMPDADICLEYVNQYADLFTRAMLLTRRNYDFTVENSLGVYNDMIGAGEDTGEWLQWIRTGDSQDTQGEPLVLDPLPQLGMAAPVGGEFTSSISMEQILGKGLGDTLAQISESHMTFIGPNMPDVTLEENGVSLQSILRRVGYRIYVSALETNYNFGDNSLQLNLSWKNAGNGGFFFEWPVQMIVYNGEKEAIYWENLSLDLRDLNDGREHLVSTTIPFSDEIGKEFYLGISITSPDGDEMLEMAIRMQEDLGWIDGSRIIYHYVRE